MKTAIKKTLGSFTFTFIPNSNKPILEPYAHNKITNPVYVYNEYLLYNNSCVKVNSPNVTVDVEYQKVIIIGCRIDNNYASGIGVLVNMIELGIITTVCSSLIIPSNDEYINEPIDT